MKYVIDSELSIQSIPNEATQIHLTRPLTVKGTLLLLKKCKKIKKITFSASCAKRIGSKISELFKKNNIELKVEKSLGRPLSINLEKMLYIAELKKDYRSYGEIEKMTGVPKSTVHYLIKYAKKSKVKKGKASVELNS